MPDVPDIIRIRTTLTSDTPHLPELAPLVGRRVEVIVTPEPTEPQVYETVPAEYPWPTREMLAEREAAMEFLRSSTYDWDARKEQREFDLRHEKEELRKWQERQADEGQP